MSPPWSSTYKHHLDTLFGPTSHPSTITLSTKGPVHLYAPLSVEQVREHFRPMTRTPSDPRRVPLDDAGNCYPDYRGVTACQIEQRRNAERPRHVVEAPLVVDMASANKRGWCMKCLGAMVYANNLTWHALSRCTTVGERDLIVQHSAERAAHPLLHLHRDGGCVTGAHARPCDGTKYMCGATLPAAVRSVQLVDVLTSPAGTRWCMGCLGCAVRDAGLGDDVIRLVPAVCGARLGD